MDSQNREDKAMFTVLMAEDDPDDRFVMEHAFEDLQGRAELRFVKDGEELMEYLQRFGRYTDKALSPRPGLILLDLNMPKKDGREALVEIKAVLNLQKIPIVVWTTSTQEEDKIQCREAGADHFVTKPLSYTELENTVRELVIKYSGKPGSRG
jgi:CheY-like chemotaxis protein